MEHTLGQLFVGEIGGGEAEDVGIQYWLGAQAGTQGVPYHPTDAGGSSPVGFDGRGVVMGLDLKAQRPLAVKIDGPGIIPEDREAPRLG